MINFLRLVAIASWTAFLAILGILSCLVWPSGDGVLALARLWARTILRLSRVTVEVHGAENVQKPGPFLFLANHQSQFDILAAVTAVPVQFRILAKKELFYIPLFGWVIYLAGFVGIDRGNREKAIRSLERAAARMRGGASLLIYAEGTRSSDGRLLPFKKGGFVLGIKAGVPVVPVTIQGGAEILTKGSLTIRPGTMRVDIGKPIDSRAFRLEEKEALMKQVRNVMESHLAAEGRPRRA